MQDDNEDISTISRQVQTFCEEHDVAHEKGMRAGLLTEEMCVFAASQNKEFLFIDIMLRVFADRLQIEFRSLGAPANPLPGETKEQNENVAVLQKMPSKLEYDYSLGMNSAKITIER